MQKCIHLLFLAFLPLLVTIRCMFQGSIVALVTPMREGGGPETPLDRETMAQLVDFHMDAGTDALVVAGTTGESATLDEAEHCRLIEDVVRMAAGRLPVIAGTGANSTREAIVLTRCAQQAGADACLLVTPYYNKPTQEGLYWHHRAVADAIDIPQILYNVPGRTACDMLPETVARLAELPNVVGIKEASGQLERVAQLRELCGEEFTLLTGEDGNARGFIALGGQGAISVTANVAPKLMHEMCSAGLSGDQTAAQATDSRLQGLHKALFLESNPIPAKWALHRMGMIEPGIRLPLTWLAGKHEAALTAAMQAAGVVV